MNRKKTLILFGVYLVLFVPVLGIMFNGYLWPLNGAFYNEPKAELNSSAWFSSAYQEQTDKYLRNNFGLHNAYVRVFNQLDFWFFKKAHARYVVVGKENYLYETGYIDAYYGKDFVGEAEIKRKMAKLKQVQDSLQKQNKLLLLVFAPGKASFYPEYIPDNYKRRPDTSNFEVFAKHALTLRLNHINFRDYFISQKEKSPYPLYPQLGIHWSNYGSIMALDSMLTYMNEKLNLPPHSKLISYVQWLDTLQLPDNDVVRSMNLYKRPETFKMAYPVIRNLAENNKNKKLKLLTIADSFWWYIYSTGIPDQVFEKNSFWYYNEEVYPESFSSSLRVSETDYYSRIRESDVIVILYTESNLYKFGDGFVDMCYETFCAPDPQKENIQKMKASIRATPEWYEQVIKKADEKGITVDSMLTLDAIYTVNQSK